MCVCALCVYVCVCVLECECALVCVSIGVGGCMCVYLFVCVVSNFLPHPLAILAHIAEQDDDCHVAEGSAGSFTADSGAAAVRGDAEED